MYVAAIILGIESNTLEATWLELAKEKLKRVKARNHSQDQKSAFEADVETAISTRHWLIGKQKEQKWH